MEQNFKFFLDKVYPSLLVATGLVGNSLIFAIYSRRRFQKLAIKNIWRLLAIVDTCCILLFLRFLLKNYFNIDVTFFSSFTCKFLNFLNFLKTVSAWLLTYISIERFLSILFTRLSKKIQLVKTQAIICLLIFVFNILFYSQLLFYCDLKLTISNNMTTNLCGPFGIERKIFDLFSLFDLIISSFLPFFFMLTCSVVLINSIFKSRKRLATSKSQKESKQIVRDIRFSLTAVAMNILFFIFTLPLMIVRLVSIDRTSLAFSLSNDFYHTQFVGNFFIYLTINSIFRQEFLSMLHLK
jgi:hypothetical protein